MNIEATIIVMVYKNLNQVIQTLDSIKKQTYSNYEVIVSDDGSPNYTQEDFDKITEQYKNEFTYFKLINNGINRGTVKHFNSLISQAKGTIICPLSSGDQFYNENSLQEIMNAFDQEDKLIYTSKRMIKKENNIEYYPSLYQVSLLDQSNHFFEYIMKYGNFVSGASTYYKKEIVVESRWAELAQTDDTLVFYMSAETVGMLAAKLKAHGIDPSKKLAVIEQATTPHQSVHVFDMYGDLKKFETYQKYADKTRLYLISAQ